MKPGDAFNMLLAQIELREGLPFQVPPARQWFSTPNNKPPSGRRRSVPTDPKPGEVWFAELGMVEKSRPVLVLAFPEDRDALAVVAPLTSQIRGMRS